MGLFFALERVRENRPQALSRRFKENRVIAATTMPAARVPTGVFNQVTRVRRGLRKSRECPPFIDKTLLVQSVLYLELPF